MSRLRALGIALFFALVTAVCGEAAAAVSHCTPQNICYVGHWEFVSGRFDGRFEGHSARSFTRGDNLSIEFAGPAIRVYGLTGPTGGRALLLVGKRPPLALNFYSARPRKHVLLYANDRLGPGNHFAVLVVTGTHTPGSRGGYVNVDDVELDGGR